MTQVDATTQREPLGVGAIIGDTFVVYARDFFRLTAMGLLASVCATLIEVAQFRRLSAGFDQDDNSWLIYLISTSDWTVLCLDLILSALVSALVVKLVYDAKLGRRTPFWLTLKSVLPVVPLVFVLTVLTTGLTIIGILGLIIGAFWVSAVFFVVQPIAVIERAGFGSLARSIDLTQGYRWPIVGCFVVFTVIGILPALAGDFFFGSFREAFVSGASHWPFAFGYAVCVSFTYVLMGIAIALVYARLREIKEGVAVEQIAAVFD